MSGIQARTVLFLTAGQHTRSGSTIATAIPRLATLPFHHGVRETSRIALGISAFLTLPLGPIAPEGFPLHRVEAASVPGGCVQSHKHSALPRPGHKPERCCQTGERPLAGIRNGEPLPAELPPNCATFTQALFLRLADGQPRCDFRAVADFPSGWLGCRIAALFCVRAHPHNNPA